MPDAARPILEATGLCKSFSQGGLFGGGADAFRALDNVALSVMPGEIVGLVAEGVADLGLGAARRRPAPCTPAGWR